MVVVPDLTRAEAEGRLGSEFRAYALAFLAVAVPATVVTAVLRQLLGRADHRAAAGVVGRRWPPRRFRGSCLPLSHS